MSIRNRLLVTFLLISLIPIAAIAALATGMGQDALKLSIGEKLELIVREKTAAIDRALAAR